MYHVEISSLLPGPYSETFTIQNHDGTELKPVTVTVHTENQTFALFEGKEPGKNWQTQYNFTITPYWLNYPEYNENLAIDVQNFYIRDYCAAMSINGSPLITMDQANFNLTALDAPEFNETQGNFTEPFSYNISKYLMSEDSMFELQNITFTMYRPPNSTADEELSDVCGKLVIKTVSRSYEEEEWSKDDLIHKKEGGSESSALSESMKYIVSAKLRPQIGYHSILMRISSDKEGLEATSQELKFNIEILDCRVDKFTLVEQFLPYVSIEIGDSINLGFKEYVQEPSCGFAVDYTLTLIERQFGSSEQPKFQPELEGTTTDPKFAVLYPEYQTLLYNP